MNYIDKQSFANLNYDAMGFRKMPQELVPVDTAKKLIRKEALG